MIPTPALLERLQTSLGQDLTGFLPELILIVGIALNLFLRLLPRLEQLHKVRLSMLTVGLALFVALGQWYQWPPVTPQLPFADLFTGLIRFDAYSQFIRIFLLGFLFLLFWLNWLTGIPDRDDSADYSTLVMGSTLGMMLMASANHLMMIFIAIEMASVPSYALAGFLKGKRQGSEAALKYVIYGAAASGIMLYGISLLCARFGSGSLVDLLIGLELTFQSNDIDLLMLMGLIFLFVGLAFKLSLVPFHFWCPDVFTGAAAEVGAFLSVASKAAAVALTGRLFFTLFGEAFSLGSKQLILIVNWSMALIALATITLGNLAAMTQTNIKRMLAYSTISHAGFLLLGITTLRQPGLSAVMFYLAAYLLMNLGAFAVVALLRNRTGSEELDSLRGAIHHSPILVIAMVVFMLSLLGMPPLAGFAAKFQIFATFFDSGLQISGELPLLQQMLYGVLLLAGLNVVISAGYYLRVVRTMIFDAPPESTTTIPSERFGEKVYVLLLALFVVLGGIFWNPMQKATDYAASTVKVRFDFRDRFDGIFDKKQ